MPISYERFDDRQLVVFTVDGPFDAATINDAMSRLDAEDLWTDAVLWDLRKMSGRPTTDDLWSFSRAYVHDPHEAPRERGPIAVVTDDEGMYRSACLYVVMAKPRLQIDVFRQIDEAEGWLVNRLAPR